MASSGKLIRNIDVAVGADISHDKLLNRTRQLWKGATEFVATAVGPTQAILATFLWPYWTLDATTNESIVTTYLLPEDYVLTTSIQLEVWFFTPNANAGNVLLYAQTRPLADGSAIDLDSYPDTTGVTIAVPEVTNQIKVGIITSAGFTANPGRVGQLVLARNAADAADTYGSRIHVVGVKLRYTADS